MFSLANLITWIVVGLIGGNIVSQIVTRTKAGFGFFSNLALGCAGAVVGGVFFTLFNILPSLDNVSVSARDLLAAMLGSLVVLLGYWIWRRNKTPAV